MLGGAEAEDPVIDTAATIQQSMATAVDTVGAAGWLALGGLLLISTGVLALRQRRFRPRPADLWWKESVPPGMWVKPCRVP